MRAIVTLCLVLLGLMTSKALAGKQNTYLIKSEKVSNTAEALTILRRFMPNKLEPDARCEKYAVMLDAITHSHMDQFKLAELGLELPALTRIKFRAIDVETLRQLYIDGINTFRSNHIDGAMLELVDCLSKKFRTLDAKARSYLNNKDLQDIMRQYKSIMGQPLTFLVQDTATHPDLTYDELKPAVKTTLLDLFNQDIHSVSSRFQSSGAHNEPMEGAASEAVASVDGVTPNERNLQQPPINEVLSDADLELVHKITGSLHEVYNNLPVDSKLGDRCLAYSQVIQADQENLNSKLVESIIQETANKIATSGPSDKVFKPDPNVRENFLFTLSIFPKADVGHETWIDLVDCVSQWADEDPEVKEFMSRPEQAQIFDELMRAPEVDGVQLAETKAAATSVPAAVRAA